MHSKRVIKYLLSQFYEPEEAMEFQALQLVVVNIMRGDIEDDFDYLSSLQINIETNIYIYRYIMK